MAEMHNASSVAATFDMDVDIPNFKAEPDTYLHLAPLVPVSKDDMGGPSIQAEYLAVERGEDNLNGSGGSPTRLRDDMDMDKPHFDAESPTGKQEDVEADESTRNLAQIQDIGSYMRPSPG